MPSAAYVTYIQKKLISSYKNSILADILAFLQKWLNFVSTRKKLTEKKMRRLPGALHAESFAFNVNLLRRYGEKQAGATF